MTTRRSPGTGPRSPTWRADRHAPIDAATDRRLDELAFLHEIAQLATLARDWDELMRSIVDGTTVAMGVEVCSFYLADHEKTRLTLAATNGLDRTQVGKVSLGWGMGITGRVAATREPIAVVDVTKDERFSWVRGFDIEGLTAMLSVPLVWHDGVVGVLNVQTRDARRFDDGEIAFLQTIAALLAGIVEKGRLTAEVEAPAGPADRARCGPGRAAERRDPRASDAAVGRARVRRPARRGGVGGGRRGPGVLARRRHRAARAGSTGWWTRSSPRSAARA